MKLPTWVRGCPSQNAGSTIGDDARRRHPLVVVGRPRRHVDVRVKNLHLGSAPTSRGLHRETDIGRHGTARGAPLVGVVTRHPRQFGVEAAWQPDDARQGDAVEERLQHQLVEVPLGKVLCGVRVLARHRLEQRQDIGAAGVDDRREKAFRLRQDRRRFEPASLLGGIAALVARDCRRDKRVGIATLLGNRQQQRGPTGIGDRPCAEACIGVRRRQQPAGADTRGDLGVRRGQLIEGGGRSSAHGLLEPKPGRFFDARTNHFEQQFAR